MRAKKVPMVSVAIIKGSVRLRKRSVVVVERGSTVACVAIRTKTTCPVVIAITHQDTVPTVSVGVGPHSLGRSPVHGDPTLVELTEFHGWCVWSKEEVRYGVLLTLVRGNLVDLAEACIAGKGHRRG